MFADPAHRTEADWPAGAPLVRMNGIGNAILVLDLRGTGFILPDAAARALHARPGLAFDQLMAIHDPAAPGTDAALLIYNNDGSRSAACGNGTRCVAWYLLDGSDRDALTLTSGDAPLAVRRVAPLVFSVDMGAPVLEGPRIPVRAGGDLLALDLGVETALGRPVAVGMGNPHAVFFLDEVATLDLPRIGPPLEHAPAFPEKANISFARVIDRETIELRVWERGAGATLACGTGACATVVAAALTNRTGRSAHVSLPGGTLRIDWRASDDHVIMTGAVEVERRTTLGEAFTDATAP